MTKLTGRLADVRMDGEVPTKEDLPLIFDELDYQMACQVYLWALPIVSYAQWKTQHYNVFGATSIEQLAEANSPGSRLGGVTQS